MGARFLEFAMYLRQRLEEREVSVPQAHLLCGDDVPVSNWYQWLRGERVPCSWQLKRLEKRMNFNTPDRYLMGKDNYGVPKKDRQLKLPGLREVKR